jgi:hypothetical protein
MIPLLTIFVHVIFIAYHSEYQLSHIQSVRYHTLPSPSGLRGLLPARQGYMACGVKILCMLVSGPIGPQYNPAPLRTPPNLKKFISIDNYSVVSVFCRQGPRGGVHGAKVRHKADGAGQPELCPGGESNPGSLLSDPPPCRLPGSGHCLSGQALPLFIFYIGKIIIKHRLEIYSSWRGTFGWFGWKTEGHQILE